MLYIRVLAYTNEKNTKILVRAAKIFENITRPQYGRQQIQPHGTTFPHNLEQVYPTAAVFEILIIHGMIQYWHLSRMKSQDGH